MDRSRDPFADDRSIVTLRKICQNVSRALKSARTVEAVMFFRPAFGRRMFKLLRSAVGRRRETKGTDLRGRAPTKISLDT